MVLYLAAVAFADWEGFGEQDPITDDVIAVIAVESTSNHYGTEYILFARLETIGNESDYYLGINVTPSLEEDIECITRVDQAQPYIYDLTYLPDFGLHIFPSEEFDTLFNQLLRGNQFAVRFTPEFSETVTILFSLEGMTVAAVEAGLI